MNLCSPVARLGRDTQGAAAVEFAILGGFMITMLLGVLQIGTAMQTYNALRGITADVARNTVVQYQTGNELTSDQIRAYARTTALGSPYYIQAEGLHIDVGAPIDPGISGTKEIKIKVRAQVNSILDIIGLRDFYMTEERSIYVIDD